MSMASEVRPVADDAELAAAWNAVGTAFLSRPSDEVVEWRRTNIYPEDRERVLIAIEDGSVCGTARSFATPLTLPGGGEVTMGAVSAVGVLPTHRRRGHLSRLMDLQLGDIAERGEPLAGLIAAEWPIYGRYGYGMAIPAATYEVDSRAASFLEQTWHGTVELTDLAGFHAAAPAVFEAHRTSSPGAIGRTERLWDAWYGTNPQPGETHGNNAFFTLHRDRSGTVDGYCAYSTKQSWERSIPSGRVDVRELVTNSAGAYSDLWRFLCEIDWTWSVKASPRPVDEPLPFLLADGRAVQRTHFGDHIWVRLLDIPGVLTARRYRTAGHLVIEVADDVLGRGGRFALDAGEDGSTCERSSGSADLTMPIATLGALCLGGTPASLLAAAGLLDEHTPDAIGRADTLFGWSPSPFCSTNF
jgi:predicted acetyltransferase